MTYDVAPLGELVKVFVDTGVDSFSKAQDTDLDRETAKIGAAIVARGETGANALRVLLNDKREAVQFLAAAWLSELDPYGAAPTLERLVREAEDPAIKGFARLKLHNNRERGLLPAR